jgi:hypothetical protein
MTFPVEEVAKLSIQVLKETGVFENVKDWILGKGEYTIIVLGASGTGKTSLGLKLRGLTSTVPREIRTHVAEVVRGKLEHKLRIKFIETPGQLAEPFKGERFRAIQKAMAEPNLGIINVTSYGYHEGKAEQSQATTVDHTPRKTYLENRRDEEILLLQEWVNLLCGPGGRAKWLITACSKADLWLSPDPKRAVMNHYEAGAYFQALGEAQSTDHAVLRFSAHNQLFYDSVPMSGFYTDELRNKDQAVLVARILANCAREQV